MVYTEDDRTLRFAWEMAGAGTQHVQLAPLNLNRWTTPTTESVPVSKQLEILAQLRDWLTNQGITSDLDRPPSAPPDFDMTLLARES
jgi:hypothetical protein